ncbi:hypothetical protein VTJ04DRAFT_8984 [Mycothermus thermophilus]|uniref:uncharacterized protein n=1 Tax=Humicola insolens TaxID=85995 RepID=UPI003742C442
MRPPSARDTEVYIWRGRTGSSTPASACWVPRVKDEAVRECRLPGLAEHITEFLRTRSIVPRRPDVDDCVEW